MRTVLLLASLFSLPAFAEEKPLFVIQKPVNPENLVQTVVNVNPDCSIGALNFFWLRRTPSGGYTYNQTFQAYVKAPNGCAKKYVLGRLQPGAESHAVCDKIAPGATCFEKVITSADVGRVRQGVQLAIVSVKSRSTGACSVGAYMDTGSGPTQVGQINVFGSYHTNLLAGAINVTFSGVQVYGMVGNNKLADWTCQSGSCNESVPVTSIMCP